MTKIRLLSTGKSAILSGQIDADLYVDCRVMHNPHRIFFKETGDDQVVQEWIEKNNPTFLNAVLDLIFLGLKTAETRNSFKRDPLKPFTVCFFCLAGVHRSRGTKRLIARYLQEDPQFQVEVA